MSKEDQLRHVLDCGIVAVVRSPDSQQLVEVVRALADGGVTVAEITMTVPGALDVVKAVRSALGDRVLLGAGTILDPETARSAILAGAEYIVAPTINLDVIKLARLRPMDKTMFEEAHAVFRIRENRIKFGQLDLIGNAVSLGGDGEMDLDGKNAQFEFYTVWTNIRNLLGGTGELPARVSSNLYRIRVSGNLGVDKPRVTQEPLPAVLEPVRRLLGRANP